MRAEEPLQWLGCFHYLVFNERRSCLTHRSCVLRKGQTTLFMFLGFWTFAVASRMDVQYRQYISIGTECVDSCDGLVMAPFGRWQRAYCSLEVSLSWLKSAKEGISEVIKRLHSLQSQAQWMPGILSWYCSCDSLSFVQDGYTYPIESTHSRHARTAQP